MKASGTKDMTTGKPAKLILFYAIPILIGNVFQQLYNMVDTIIVGRYLGNDALAGVGLTGPLSFLVLGFTVGITGGFGVIAAQRFGAKDEKGLKHSVATIIILCIFVTIVITTIALVSVKPLLRSINTPNEVFEYSYQYISIIYAGIGVTILYNMLSGLLRAIGDSKTPLYFLLIASFLNIALDLMFIINFGMGVGGAALATVISQGVSGILCLIYIIKKYPILHVSKGDFSWDMKFALKHMAIGLPMAFQFSITAIGVVILQGALNLFGSAKIAAYTAAAKVEQLVAQPAATFGVTMANYAGQNLGAGRIDRIKEGVKKCSVLTLGFSLFASFVVGFFGKYLAKMFISGEASQAADIINASQEYFNVALIFFPFLFLLFVFRNMLQGTGHGFIPLMAGVFELAARSVTASILPGLIGFKGICFAGPIAWVSACIPLAITYFITIKKLMKTYTPFTLDRK